MKIAAILTLAATLLAGCATQTKETMAAVRAAGVSSRTVAKLEHRGVMEPADLIELRRRGISDQVPLRQIDKVGVNYLVQRRDMAAMRSAGVRPEVRDALLDASDRFARDRNTRYAYSIGIYDPWPYYDPWYWPLGVSLGYSWGHRHCH